MKYNFDEIIDRKNTNCVKYDTAKMMHPELPEDFIPMWVADMDFACPQPILDAMKARLDKRILGYSFIQDPEYFDAVVGWMKRRHDWDVALDSIIYSAGVVRAMHTAVQELTAPGDGVIIQTPSYHPFHDAVVTNGRTEVRNALIEKDGHYEMDFDDLEEKAKDPHNKLFFLCSPHNPTGRVWTEEELRRVGEICFKNDVFVVCDEIHADFIRQGHKHIPFAKLFPDEKRLIVCTAPSKTFNLAGNQLSNIIIPDPVIAMKWKYGHLCGGPNPLSIDACKAAYNECENWVDELNTYVEGNLRHLKARLDAEAPVLKMQVPEGTYLAWIDARELEVETPDLMHELYLSGLFLEPGEDFVDNSKGYLRINVACPRSVLDRAIDILIKCFHEGSETLAELRSRKRLSVGETIPDFSYVTPYSGEKDLYEALNGKPTMLLFLRYYGCTVCQVDLHRLTEEYEKITAAGGQVKVALQSDPEALAKDTNGVDPFPFEIICDPELKLYHRFAIPVAESQDKLLGEKTIEKVGMAKELGLSHGRYEGEELQLPASFLILPDGRVAYARYGTDPGDTPDPEEIAELLKENAD